MSLWHRRPDPPPQVPAASTGHGEDWPDAVLPAFPKTTYPVRIYTPTHAVTGSLHASCRLSDLLNSVARVAVQDASVVALGADWGSARLVGSITIDPFEIEIAMTQPLADGPWARARRLHKIPYTVTVDAAHYRIGGTVHAFPGADPTALARHGGGVFIPVTEPTVRRLGSVVSGRSVNTVLVNRHLVRRITLVDNPIASRDLTGLLLAHRAAG